MKTSQEQPRLFAYGGTEFSVRCQIGDWHQTEPGAFQDRRGLEPGSLAIGVGIDRSSAFLILKELQTGTASRSYAYCLMLDPTTSVWEAVSWNPGKLVQALRQTGSIEILLKSPEKFGSRPELLTELLNAAKNSVGRSDQLEVPASDNSAFALAVAGMALGSGTNTQCVTLAGIAETVSSQIQEQIDSIPVYLRLGRGWLVGGQVENAHTFLINLVVPFGSSDDTSPHLKGLVEEGERFLADWNLAAEAGYLTSLQTKGPKTPLSILGADEKSMAQSFLQGVRLLAQLCGKDNVPISIYPEIRGHIDEKSVLSDEVRLAVSRIPINSKVPLSPQLTELYLDLRSADQSIGDAWKLLEREAIRANFVRNRIDPSECGLQLDDKLKSEIFLDLVESETNASRLPELLSRAIASMTSPKQTGIPDNVAVSLADAAIQRSLQLNDSAVWFDAMDRPLDLVAVSNNLRHLLLSRFLGPGVDAKWASRYLESDIDAGGILLSNANVNARNLEALFNVLTEKTVSPSNISDAVKNWISELAESSLRTQTPLQVKLRFGAISEWSAFTTLIQIVKNQHSGRVAKASDQEHGFLVAELDEALATEHHPHLSKEQLNKLGKLFGRLPETLQPVQTDVPHAEDHQKKLILPIRQLARKLLQITEETPDAKWFVETRKNQPEMMEGLFWLLSESAIQEILNEFIRSWGTDFVYPLYQELTTNPPDSIFLRAVHGFLASPAGTGPRRFIAKRESKDETTIADSLKAVTFGGRPADPGPAGHQILPEILEGRDIGTIGRIRSAFSNLFSKSE